MKRRDLLVAGAAAAALPRAVGAQTSTIAIRVATTPIDAGAQPFFARAMGFFKQAGIDASITTLTNGSAIAAAVASGAVDIGQSNVVSVASAHARGIPFVAIAGGNLVVPRVRQAAFIVPNDSPIRSAKDLEGKTIAVNGLGTIPHVGARAWIDANGGSSSSVRYLEIPFSSMAAALAAGRIDCAFLSEPELDDALASKRFRVIGYPYDAIAKTFLLGVWFTTRTWASTHPDAVRAYAAVMRKTTAWANADQAASGRILAAETGIAVTPTTTRVLFGDLDAGLIQPVIDVSARYGVLPATFPATEIIAQG